MSTSCCIKVKNFKKWSKARKFFFDLVSEKSDIYFRGQSNAKWKLQSSLGRLIDGIITTKKTAGNAEELKKEIKKKLFDKFREAYLKLPNMPRLPQESKNEFHALCQHYSLPTELLDWTRSFYIASFFAFDGLGQSIFEDDRKVAIFAINWKAYKEALVRSKQKSSSNDSYSKGELDDRFKQLQQSKHPRIELVQITGNPNRRMIFQEGLFTRMIKVEDNIEAYLTTIEQHALKTVLYKIVLPGNEQNEALRDLSLMSITPVTLMADPDGAAITAFNEVIRFM